MKKEPNFFKNILENNKFYRRHLRNKTLKKELSEQEWQEKKYRDYQYIRNLRSMQWSIATRYISRIATVAIIMFTSSTLILISILLPNALGVFKSGAINGFGSYQSYSEYHDTAINIPVTKGNSEQSFDQQVDTTDPYLSPVGGPFSPFNGEKGVDNRYSVFDENDDYQTNYAPNYTSSPLNLSLFSYLGGFVISTKWVQNLDNSGISAPAFKNTICSALGIDPNGPGIKTGVDCITQVIRQNAPAYINQKLFGTGAQPNIYLTAADIEYSYLTDTLYTHINGNIEDKNIKSEIWGLNPNSSFNLTDGQTDLFSKLNSSLLQYAGKNVFPCFVNKTLENDLKVNNAIDSNGDFMYQSNYQVGFYQDPTDPNKWLAINPNNYYWSLNNGLSVFFDPLNSPGSSTDAFLNAESTFDPSQARPTQDKVVDVNNSVDALVAKGKFKIETIPYTVKMHSIGVANDFGDARIFTTHSLANEIAGYYAPTTNDHFIYNLQAKSPFDLTSSTISELSKPTYYNSNSPIAQALTPVSLDDIKNYLSATPNAHLASDGHPYQDKIWAPLLQGDIKNDKYSLSGGYTLYSFKDDQSDIYFNGRLSTQLENADLSIFSIWTPYGNYDRFGMSDTSDKNWDPTQFANGYKCSGPADPTCIGSANQSSISVQNAYSKKEVVDAIDKIVQLITIVLYGTLLFFLVVSLIIILVSTNIVIDDNKKNISAFKIMGYRNSEVIKIITQPYFMTVILAFLLAIPVVIGIFSVLLNVIGSVTGLNLAQSGISIWEFAQWWHFAIGLVIIVFIYTLNIFLNRKALDRIKPIDVLKG
ncbi:MAG: ABC transporter permease [Mycoplasma sp.]